jgi:hypothetical protein
MRLASIGVLLAFGLGCLALSAGLRFNGTRSFPEDLRGRINEWVDSSYTFFCERVATILREGYDIALEGSFVVKYVKCLTDDTRTAAWLNALTGWRQAALKHEGQLFNIHSRESVW